MTRLRRIVESVLAIGEPVQQPLRAAITRVIVLTIMVYMAWRTTWKPAS